MKYTTRVVIGHMMISSCILLFSVIGISIAALMTKLTFSVLEWLANDTFFLSWAEVLRSLKVGALGGGILGIGINLFRFFMVKGF
jgi:hypothetical protein